MEGAAGYPESSPPPREKLNRTYEKNADARPEVNCHFHSNDV